MPSTPTAPEPDLARPTAGPTSTASRRMLAVVLFLVTAAVIAATAVAGAMGAKPGSIGDFGCFYNAGVAMRLGETMYVPVDQQTDPLYTRDGGAWIYPPGPAILFYPLTFVSPERAQQIWIGISAVLTLITVHLLALEVAKRMRAPLDALTITAFACLPTALMWDKLGSQYKLGQTDILVMLGFVLGLRYIDKRPLVAGLALGGVICIKYIAIVFIPYCILRARWKPLAGMALAVLAILLIPLPFYGWQGTLDEHAAAFAGVLKLFGVEAQGQAAGLWPLTWIRSVSLPSGFGRLFVRLGQPEELAFVAAGVVALGCLALAWTMYARGGHPLMFKRPLRDERTRADRGMLVLLEWASLITASQVFAPQTTIRHLIMTIFPLMIAAGLVLADHTPRPRWPVIVAMTLFILGMVLPPGGDRFAEALYAWRAISANSWLALVLLFTTLHFGLKHAGALRPATPPA